MSDDGGERFEIERIVEKRYRNNRLEYLIKWRGYPNSENTWEPCNYSFICFYIFSFSLSLSLSV